MFGNEKIIEEYNVKIYEIDPYFYEHCKKNKKQQQQQKKKQKNRKKTKKQQVDENGREYILFRIDVYFSKHKLTVETDKKDLQTFISKFKSRQLRKLEKESSKKMKELEDEIKKKIISIDKSNYSIK